MQRRWLVLSFLAVLGCKRAEGPSKQPPVTPDPVVATFAARRITTAELQRYFDDQSPFVRYHYGNPEGKKAVLEIMIQTQLLADQALKEGFDLDDESVEQFRKAIITQWRRTKFNEADGERDLSMADLHAYYEAHRSEYQRPERVRVRMLVFKASPGHEAAVQAEAEEAARSLAQAKDRTALSTLTGKLPGGASNGREIDLDFRSHDELAKSYGAAVADAANSLKEAGRAEPGRARDRWVLPVAVRGANPGRGAQLRGVRAGAPLPVVGRAKEQAVRRFHEDHDGAGPRRDR